MKLQLFYAKLLTLFTFIVLVGINTSCNKDSESVEDFLLAADEDIELQTRSGGGSCFELVYPITIILPDGSTAEINSKEEGREVLKAWKEANPDIRGKVKVQFPIDVITSDGEVVTISSPQELRLLKKDCKDRPHGDRRSCFRLQFPVSVTFPDGTVQSFEDRKALKTALRLWKKENPDATERPTLVFPITIVKKDGTEVVVNSKEELIEIKKDCMGR